MSEAPKTKWGLFAELLQEGVTTLHLDARRPQVRVPSHLANEPWLALNYSYRYGISDFEFDEEAVFASLSFGGRPFACRVPWSAVFAVTNEARTAGLIWQEDLPPESRAPESDAAYDTPLPPVPIPTGKPQPQPQPRPELRVLTGEAQPTDAPQPSGDPQPPRSHLRRIK